MEAGRGFAVNLCEVAPMPSADISSPAVGDMTHASSRLIAFMGELTALLPERERYETLVLFSLLSGMAFAEGRPVDRRAGLCSDGTPLELSLAINDQGRHAIRFVFDVAGGVPDGTSGVRQLRDLADKVVPRFDEATDTLDRLFDRHLEKARATTRFKVWFGAGAAPGQPRIGKLYFNTEWLSVSDVLDILAPHIRPGDAAAITAWPAACGTDYAAIGYDFDIAGMRKTQLYMRPDGVGAAKLLELLGHFPGHAGDELWRLFERGFGSFDRARAGSFVLSLGLPPRHAAGDVDIEAKVYFHLPSWGMPDFVAVAPVLSRLLGGWGVDLDSDNLSAGPRGCAPTLLALGISRHSQRLALYFKPLLQIGGS